MNDVAAIKVHENGVGRRVLGRPRGSTGHQAERLKYQLAFLTVSGKRNVQIAQMLGVCPKTVRMWLRHPAVQDEIRELEAEFHWITQRRLAALFPLSINAMKKALKHRDGRVVLRAIELLWTSLGMPQNGGLGTNVFDRQQMLPHQQNIFIHDHADAKAAMALLRKEREQQELEKKIALHPGQ